VVPSSFRVLRSLLSRIEDPATGELLLPEMSTVVPDERMTQAELVARTLGKGTYERFPFTAGMKPVSDDPAQSVLNRTWRPSLSVTGMDGIPPLRSAGNVLRPFTTAKLSFRLPPMVDAQVAAQRIKERLEEDPPYGARVTFGNLEHASGWNAPALSPWLGASVDAASQRHFGKPAVYMGEGGSIPFMGMLGEKFPEAQFMITGVLGPGSNAHGPNEFLHIPMACRITCCVADVLAEHHTRAQR
jgi:acetylornithine deacetylase/succinyl-diaminopimelate desuccinylase-like protein